MPPPGFFAGAVYMGPKPPGWAPWGPKMMLVPMDPDQRSEYLRKRRAWRLMRVDYIFWCLKPVENNPEIRDRIISYIEDYVSAMQRLPP